MVELIFSVWWECWKNDLIVKRVCSLCWRTATFGLSSNFPQVPVSPDLGAQENSAKTPLDLTCNFRKSAQFSPDLSAAGSSPGAVLRTTVPRRQCGGRAVIEEDFRTLMRTLTRRPEVRLGGGLSGKRKRVVVNGNACQMQSGQ